MSFDNQIDAFPLRVPQVDIHTIGAGGGSIAAKGADGTLEVGPQSAGAVPGPACYGRGGGEPTVSDANLLLGRLRPDRPLGGKLALSTGPAEGAFRRLADALRVDDVLGLADGVVRVAVAKMAGAVREVTVYRGHDPRSFALMAFGGAGPMHAFLVAEELGIERVVVPRWPGHLSAFGQLSADRRHDDLCHLGHRLSTLEPCALDAAVRRLEAEARAKLDRGGFARPRQRIHVSADMRYVGQSFTLSVPILPDQMSPEALRRAHRALHRETFGYADEGGDIEVVAIRLVAQGRVDPISLQFAPDRGGAPRIGEARLWFSGIWHRSPLVLRERLDVGAEIVGPALVEEPGSTTVVPPGWTVRVDEIGNLIGTVKSSELRRDHAFPARIRR
jgi:N-methylhydantoinase A